MLRQEEAVASYSFWRGFHLEITPKGPLDFREKGRRGLRNGKKRLGKESCGNIGRN